MSGFSFYGNLGINHNRGRLTLALDTLGPINQDPDGLFREIQVYQEFGDFIGEPELYLEGLFGRFQWTGPGVASLEEFYAIADTQAFTGGQFEMAVSCCGGDLDQLEVVTASYDRVFATVISEPSAAILFGVGVGIVGGATRRRAGPGE